MSEEEISDFDYSDQESDISFEDESEARRIKKIYENHTIEFEPLTLDKLIQSTFISKIASLGTILGIDNESELILLLQSSNWDEELVVDRYLSNQQVARERAGLPPIHESGRGHKIRKNSQQFMCPICCDDGSSMLTFELFCGHKYCVECYKRYIMSKIEAGTVIKCPDMDCQLNLSYKDVSVVCGDTVSRRAMRKLAKTFVDVNNRKFKWCPTPDCQYLVKVKEMIDENDIQVANIPIVSCPDRHHFCFNCNFENHIPLPCSVVKMWVQKCKDDSETANWINLNTQSCPKCISSIEKNGGCNHMTCHKCHYQFCWICLGDWNQHGTSFYKCNRYQEENKEVKSKKELSRRSLNRYLHYYNRYQIHETSMNQDLKLCSEVEHKVRLLQEASGISWIEGQFLTDAANVLANGRKTLKWTYAFVYYLKKSNHSILFESNQDYLNVVVEELSKLFELEDPHEILRNKRSFIDNASLVQIRQETLIEFANDGLLNHRLEFQEVDSRGEFIE